MRRASCRRLGARVPQLRRVDRYGDHRRGSEPARRTERVTLSIGLDVGGTKIAGCVLDVERQAVVDFKRVATQASAGGRAVLDDCVALVADLRAGNGCAGDAAPVGIGVCELVDLDGAIASAERIDWRELDLTEAFGRPVIVESDVRAGAVAEARMGAGQGCATFVYLTVGTGIAFSLVLDGTPYRGAHGNAIILGAPPVETTSSGAALARHSGTNSAETAFAFAHTAGVVNDAADHLGRALAWLVNALDPETIVVGGGLGMRQDYRQAAVTVMRTHIAAEAARDLPVVPAALGADAGAIGAALIAARA